MSSILEHPFLAIQTRVTTTPPPNIKSKNTASLQPWSRWGISLFADARLATSLVATPSRDALTRVARKRLDAFSQAIFAGLLLFEVDLVFTWTWSIIVNVFSFTATSQFEYESIFNNQSLACTTKSSGCFEKSFARSNDRLIKYFPCFFNVLIFQGHTSLRTQYLAFPFIFIE